MVAVLYIMGVSSIREFAAPLMVGILVWRIFFCMYYRMHLWHDNEEDTGDRQRYSRQLPQLPQVPATLRQPQPKKAFRAGTTRKLILTQPKEEKPKESPAERLAAEEAAKDQQNEQEAEINRYDT